MTSEYQSFHYMIHRAGDYHTGMRLGFGKYSGKFYVANDSNPNNTVGSSYLR